MLSNLNFFLTKNKIECFQQSEMLGDASLKKFRRIKTPERNMICCEMPNPETTKRFIKISNFLSQINLKVPHIYAFDCENSYVLMEDFGDDSYLNFLEKNKNRELSLYKNALDVLIEIHNQKNNNYPLTDRYTKEIMLEEVKKFIVYYLPCFKKVTTTEIELFEEMWSKILDSILPDYQTIILRDYHSPNIFYLPEMPKLKKVGIIDFEDSLIGSATYDVVSLLQDARYEISEYYSNILKNYYIKKCNWINDLSIKAFNRNYYIFGLQRSCKILGFAMYMKQYKNNNNYMYLIPLAKKYININLAKLEKSNEIKNWFSKIGMTEWI